jgi:putative ABC transport system permease protein
MRNRRRTFLTVSSISVSLFLVTTLQTVLTEIQNPPQTPDSALRLMTRHRISLFNVLPIAHRGEIARIEGVEAVIGSMWFGGIYKDPSQFFANFSVDTDQFFDVNADLVIPDEQKEAFLKDRTGAIAGRKLCEKFGWEVGDTIHLTGTLWNVDPELTLRGIYEGGNDQSTTLYFHWEYFNLLMADKGFNNFTGAFQIRAKSKDDLSRIATRIDERFRNSAAPTKTETERVFVLRFLEMMGNIQLLVTSICLAVIFAIVLVAANTMAMCIREREREIGILKAIGFQRSHILLLLLGESVLLAVGGALIGPLGAKLLYSSIDIAWATGGFLQRFHVTSGTVLLCVAIGLGVGLVSAGIPAWNASQRSVAHALRRVV